jgi:hypothetical protein
VKEMWLIGVVPQCKGGSGTISGDTNQELPAQHPGL